MAWKTPGVYFSEIDNTEYRNPAAEINTTVAIIGFAKKGPIGVPTEITTYNDYKTKFGTPIDGQYAGLAIRNVLSAGGTVLFTRVADTTIATKSNVILKNGSAAIDGSLIVNKTEDITIDDPGYELSEVYSARIINASNEEKNIILRSPSNGKLRVSNMLSQFIDSLKDTRGYDEFKVSKVINNTSYRSFNVSVYDANTLEVDKKMGPFFVKVNGSDTSSGAVSNFVNALSDKFSGTVYSNAYQKLYVLGTSKDGKIDWENMNASEFQLYLGSSEKKVFQFQIEKTKDNGTTTTKKRIEFHGISNDGSTNYFISMQDLARTLTENLVKENIYVKWCYNVADAEIKDSIEGNTAPYLLFVSMDNEVNSIELLPYTVESETHDRISTNSLFVPVMPMGENYNYDEDNKIDLLSETKGFKTIGYLEELEIDETSEDSSSGSSSVAGFSNMHYVNTDDDLEDEDPASLFGGLFCAKQKCISRVAYTSNSGSNLLNIEYIKDTVSIKFIAGDDFDVDGSKVELSRTEFGNYLFDDKNISEQVTENVDFKALKEENDLSIGKELAKVTGETKINCNVKFVNGQICFYEEGNLIPCSFANNTKSSIEGYKDLSLIIGETISESDYLKKSYTTSDLCTIEKEGSEELDPNKQDMVIFTAREYGEGTTNIGIEIYTSVSPIDGSKTHFISTIVNGITKETWEDVSYDPSAENYFVNLINEEPENNGSEYIKVKVVKKDLNNVEVLLSDTINYTDNGIVYLGTPINSNSVNRIYVNAKEQEYSEYDYSLGNNGIPEDTSDLFVEAMDTLNSGLSNKDLYAWHILITPDNITEEVQDAAINLCEYMEDAIYIADPPQGLSRDKVIKWHNGKYARSSALQSNYTCTYWPWLKVYDSASGKYSWTMPSVLMAAQFCRTDNWYAPWYAPAGETCGLISSAIDIENYPNKNDRDQLYLDQNRINPFIRLRNGNILAFGEKTCQRKNSTLTKIHTRRMLCALKHDLRNSIKGFLFLPTMAENISSIRGIVTAIMEDVKVNGGVTSYTVICDETNNTTETLQQDILNIAVSCVPTGCLEQVEITFTLNKSAETVTAS